MPVTAMLQIAAVVCLLFVAAAGSPIAAGQPVLIDFEHFPGPDGIIGTSDDIPAPPCPGPSLTPCFNLSNEFSSMGLTFTSGTLFQGNLFPGSAPTNHFLSSTTTDASFSGLVTGVSIRSYSAWTATLYALDENSNVIVSNTTAGVGTLSVSSSRPIRRFVVLPAGCQIGGNNCQPILNLDDLVLTAAATPGPTAVPTVEGWGLLVFAALLATAGAYAASRLGGAR